MGSISAALSFPVLAPPWEESLGMGREEGTRAHIPEQRQVIETNILTQAVSWCTEPRISLSLKIRWSSRLCEEYDRITVVCQKGCVIVVQFNLLSRRAAWTQMTRAGEIRHAPFVSLARVLRELALIISALARAFLSPRESRRPWTVRARERSARGLALLVPNLQWSSPRLVWNFSTGGKCTSCSTHDEGLLSWES